MAGTGPTVAAFDFDGTLSRRDTLLPFLQQVCGAQRLYRGLARQAPGVARGLLRGGTHRDAAKDALLVHLLAGTPLEAVERAAAHYVDVLLHDRLRPDTLARLRWHRDEGHDVAIVSASPAVYLGPLGERLGVQAVLATELEVGDDGRLTGRMWGRNCRGPEKVARLDRWLAGLPGGDGCRLYAYGDSAGDRELLARADVGVRVGGRPIPAAGP